MGVLQEIDGWGRVDEKKNLYRLFNRSKLGDRLLHAIVKDVKVLALEALDEISFSVRDDYADVRTVDVYLNGLALTDGNFLRHTAGGGEKQREAGAQRKFAGPREFHREGVSPSTRRSERPFHLSTMRRSWCASGAGTPRDSLCPRRRKVSFAMLRRRRSSRWPRLSSPPPASELSSQANPPFECRSRKSRSPFRGIGFGQQEDSSVVPDRRSRSAVLAKREEARSSTRRAASLASWPDGRNSTERHRPSFARHAAKF